MMSPSSHSSLLLRRLKHWAGKRWKGIVTVLSHKAWNYNNIGYIPIEFLLMVVSFWGPNVALSLFPGYSTDEIDIYVGATSLVAGQTWGHGWRKASHVLSEPSFIYSALCHHCITGIIGSLGGGFLLDKVGSSLKNSFRLGMHS